MTLTDIATVLECSRGAASQLRDGTYPSPKSSLAARYAVLARIASDNAHEPDVPTAAEIICRACPREACTGCRILEL